MKVLAKVVMLSLKDKQFETVKRDVLRKDSKINPGKACRLLYASAKVLAKKAVVSSRKKKQKDGTQEEEKMARIKPERGGEKEQVDIFLPFPF